MDLVFKALADQNRRILLDRLFADQGQTLGRLCEDMAMSRQAVSKHLAILERAELVSVLWQGREKHYFLNPLPLVEISERWIDKYARSQASAVLALKRAVETTSEQETMEK